MILCLFRCLHGYGCWWYEGRLCWGGVGWSRGWRLHKTGKMSALYLLMLRRLCVNGSVYRCMGVPTRCLCVWMYVGVLCWCLGGVGLSGRGDKGGRWRHFFCVSV